METIQIELHRTVGRHGRGPPKHHLPHVDGDLGAQVHHVCDRFRLRAEIVPAGSAVCVELNVREIGGLPFCIQIGNKPHCSDRAGVVPRLSQIIAVKMHGMRKTKHLVRFDDSFDILGRAEVEVGNGLSDTFHILSPAPHLGAKWIGQFDPVAFHGIEPPGDKRGRPLYVSGGYGTHDSPVTVEEGENKTILERRVFELLMGMPGFKRGHCSFGERSIPHKRIPITVPVGCRDTVSGHGTHPLSPGSPSRPHILGAHVPAEVHLRSADMRMGVYSSRKGQTSAGIDDFGSFGLLIGDSAV